MQRRTPVQYLAHPVVAGGLATMIVLLLGAIAASHLTIRSGDDIPLKGAFEKIAIMRSVAQVQPHLSVMPSATAAPSGQDALSAPQIARTGKVSLYVENIDKAVAAVSRVAHGNEGDVFSMDVANGDDSGAQPSGTMEIRVPSGRFDAAMSEVSQSGKVRERSTSAEDLTGDITDSSARLRNLLRTEADIRKVMDRSGSVEQIMNVENQLSQVREHIEELESQLKDMRGRVSYSTIDIDLQTETSTAPVTPTAVAQLTSTWQAALAALQQLTVNLLGSVLWVVVFVPYGLLAAAAVWFAFRLSVAHRIRHLESSHTP